MTTPTLAPLTAERALELLREVVADFGDGHVYVNASGQRAGQVIDGSKVAVDCSYVHGVDDDLRPGCLVGQVLHRHGVSLVVLSTYEGSSFGTFGQDEGFATEDAEMILQAAQAEQDQGNSWGKALAAAEAQMKEIIEVRAALAAGELPTEGGGE